MSHYLVTVPINKEDVEVVRKHLNNYLEHGGEIAIGVDKLEDNSMELLRVIRKLFVELLSQLKDDNFEGLH
jgi:HKD family nuclease